MIDFEKKIGYTFRNCALLKEALTHSSAANEKSDGTKSNERLEFIGDAVLDLVVGKELYDRASHMEEGQMSKLRALIVCEKALAECGKTLNLNDALELGRGEEMSGGRNRPSIIADAMEALIGAIFIDGGYDAASYFVRSVLDKTVEEALSGKLFRDFKTELQERLQSRGEVDIRYQVDKEEGPDHNKTFYVSLWFGGQCLGEGKGKTKKSAEQNAAKIALEDHKVVF